MSTCVIKGGETLRKSVSSLALAFLLIFISSEIVNQNLQLTELNSEHKNPVAQDHPVESEVRKSPVCPEVNNKPCHCPTSNSTSSIVKHVKSLAHHRQNYISQVLQKLNLLSLGRLGCGQVC